MKTVITEEGREQGREMKLKLLWQYQFQCYVLHD